MKRNIPNPPVFFWIALLAAVALHFALPVRQLVVGAYRFIGIAGVVFGLWLNLWTDRLFTKHGTTVKPYETSEHLIAEGPFLISRHPMYMGMVIALVGLAVILGSIVSFLPAIVFAVVMGTVFIPHEEADMERTFGDEYRAYRKRVRRWV